VPSAAIEGSLSEVGLPDVLQLLTLGGKTGTLHLREGDAEGSLHLRDGQVVHAHTGDLEGEEAAYALATWRSGRFSFEPGTRSPATTIERSNTALLMEAARRSDEWQLISEKIPSTAHVPEFVVPESAADSEGQINLNTREWQLLSKIDGRRSVREIAAASGLSTFDAAKLLVGLVSTNLIRVKPPPGLG
jgi:hypothetical protein